ncbi:MAG: hypothetical protein A2017_12775 [Lentisphaerae bacterium GWF2_44_16]|nr:MAG: hypothetical protein A2017_12775 [Lentisphaerae bacterium GWF2_44_16]
MNSRCVIGFLFRFTLYVLLIFSPIFHLAGDIAGTVTASKLNVRVRPGLGSVAVAALEKGSVVNILCSSGDWYQIKAPSDTTIWVAAPFIESGILKDNANLRAGPSVAFEAYPPIKNGAKKVNVLETFMSHWLRISPPEGLSAWVNSKYVSVADEDISKIPALNKSDGTMTEKNTDIPDSAQAAVSENPKKRQAISFIENDVSSVALEGVLLPLDSDAVTVTHALALKVNDEYFPVAYVYSAKDNLDLWKKRNVRINGLQRWVKGWKLPVIEIERITPAGQ